jgi:hypothetical protein
MGESASVGRPRSPKGARQRHARSIEVRSGAGRGGDAVDQAALDLLAHELRIDDPAAIDGADRAQHADALVGADLHLDQVAMWDPKALCAARPMPLPSGRRPSRPARWRW